MRNFHFLIICQVIFFISCSPKKELDNKLYSFNNCVRTLPNAPKEIDAQAELINKVGFDGFAGHHSEDYFMRRASLDKYDIEMSEIYWGIDIDSAGNMTYKDGLKEAIADSKNRGLMVAIYADVKHHQNNKEAGDPLLAKGIQTLADYAKSFGVKIGIYPHVNNYCETVEHSVRLAKMADRDNVGAIFNTCHLLKVEGEDGWEQKLVEAIPYLYMISISGADSGNTKEMGWDRLIQPLGEGTFDTYKLVKLAKDNGYDGLFGLQCYNINQDCETALTKSMKTWKEYQKKYADGQ